MNDLSTPNTTTSSRRPGSDFIAVNDNNNYISNAFDDIRGETSIIDEEILIDIMKSLKEKDWIPGKL